MDWVKRYSGFAGVLLLMVGYLSFLDSPDRPAIHLPILVAGGLALALGVYWNRKRLSEFLKGRAVRSGTGAALYTLVVLAIWVLVNLLSVRHHHRFDFTEEGAFTLAEQTIKVLRNLPRPVQVTAFVGEGEPGIRRRLTDLLDEYQYYGGQLSVEFVDPIKSPQKVREYEITQSGTLVFESGGQQERVTEHKEEDFTNAILKVTRDRKKKVYFTRGHGEREIDDFQPRGVSQAREVLEKQQYEVDSVQLAQGERVPEDATVLIVAGPEAPFLEMEAEMVRDWVGAGGHLLVLSDPDRKLGLEALLARYGLKVVEDRVINISPISQLMGFDALVPLGNEYLSHAITENLRIATFYPDASSVELISEGLDPEVRTQYLVQTDEQSWAERDPEEIVQGRVQFHEGVDRKGPIPIAAVATAEVEPDREAIPPEDLPGEGEEPEEEPGRETRVVLFGDSDFASNQFFNMQGNGDLFLNVIGWLAEEEDLISIRPKMPTSRTLILTARQDNMIFYSTVVGTPLTFLFLGFFVWWRRRKL